MSRRGKSVETGVDWWLSEECTCDGHEQWELRPKGTRPLLSDKNVLKLIVVMFLQVCEYTKNC